MLESTPYHFDFVLNMISLRLCLPQPKPDSLPFHLTCSPPPHPIACSLPPSLYTQPQSEDLCNGHCAMNANLFLNFQRRTIQRNYVASEEQYRSARACTKVTGNFDKTHEFRPTRPPKRKNHFPLPPSSFTLTQHHLRQEGFFLCCQYSTKVKEPDEGKKVELNGTEYRNW